MPKIGIKDCLEEMRMSIGEGGRSTGLRKPMKKGTSMTEFITSFKEASGVISKSIEEVTHTILD